MAQQMIYIGADHGGFELKEKLKLWLTEWKLEFEDLGNYSLVPNDDYPDFAFKLTAAIKKDDRGILLCRSGQGMAMAANRFPHIRAELGLNEEETRRGRQDEDANVLVLAADFLDEGATKKIIEVFLKTPFSNEERHRRRIEKLTNVIS